MDVYDNDVIMEVEQECDRYEPSSTPIHHYNIALSYAYFDHKSTVLCIERNTKQAT